MSCSTYFSEVKASANADDAFKDIDVAILVGAMPRREGMERKDLLKANVKIFQQQGKALDQFAKKDVKVTKLYMYRYCKICEGIMR